jgi:mandelate racemase
MSSSSLPTIQELSVTTVLVPITPPHRTAGGLIAASPLVLVDVECSGGLQGHAIIFTYSPAALKPVAELVLNLKPLILENSLAPAAVNAHLNACFRLLGTQGLSGMAIAGIDMALWDALARHQALPLCRLLGGQPTDVPAYGGTGFDGESGTAEQAEQWVKRGFRGVKAKFGYATVEEDRRVIRAMRAAVGDGIALMVDYNQSLDPVAACERLQQLDEEGLTWVEEPVLAHDYKNSARVKDAVKTPIQNGENWWGPMDMQHALDADASDLVMPDVMKIGGITGWLSAVALAEARGKPVSSHLWSELSAQLLARSSHSHWLEYVDWWAPILKSPLVIENGLVAFDESMVGTGVDWNKGAVEKFRI